MADDERSQLKLRIVAGSLSSKLEARLSVSMLVSKLVCRGSKLVFRQETGSWFKVVDAGKEAGD
jgi:hypothetical protein